MNEPPVVPTSPLRDPGQMMRLVLVDPAGVWTHGGPELEVALGFGEPPNDRLDSFPSKRVANKAKTVDFPAKTPDSSNQTLGVEC